MLEAGAEDFFLLIRLVALEIFGGSEMRVGAFEFEMLAIGKRAGEGVYFDKVDAQAIHAGIDFQVKAHARLSAGGFCAALEMLQIIDAGNRRREIVLHEPLFFARPKAGED